MSSYFSDDSNAIFRVSRSSNDSKWLCHSGTSIPIEKPALVPWIRWSQVTLQWLQNIVDLFFDSVHLEDIAVPFKGPGRSDGANCCERENLKNSGKVTVFPSGSIARNILHISSYMLLHSSLCVVLWSDRSLVRLFHALQQILWNDYPISNLVDSSGDALQHREIYMRNYILNNMVKHGLKKKGYKEVSNYHSAHF